MIKNPETGYADLIMGCAWGDEGKGLEAARRIMAGNYGVGVRFNGGANAGHERGDITLNQVPSSVGLVEYNLLANGSLVDPELLLVEFDSIHHGLGLEITPDNFGISDTAHIVMPHHKLLDGVRESGDNAQGTTKKGISFVAADKYGRKGVRGELFTLAPHKIKDMVLTGLHLANTALEEHGKPKIQPEVEFYRWVAAARELIPYMVESIELLDERLKDGVNLLLESAQAPGLDMEFGIYPLNSSSHVGPGGALNGTGINIHRIRDIVCVAKVPVTRVGGEDGPFPTKLKDQDGEVAALLRGKKEEKDGEFGKVSGRARYIGEPDAFAMKSAVERMGVTELVLTKLDKVPLYGNEVRLATGYTMNGKPRKSVPNSALKLAACTPEYETFKNWTEDISGIRDFSALPPEAQRFVSRIEEVAGATVTTIGVGPNAHQVIKRPKPSSNGNGRSPSKSKVPAAV